jgi:hypothetical protein
MDRYESTARPAGGSPPSEAWFLAQALLGKPVSNPAAATRDAGADREHLEWLAQISTRHAEQLRKLQGDAAEARRERKQLEWLASISEEHECKLRTVLSEEAEARHARQRYDRLIETQIAQEAWDPAKHPRQGGPPNPGWWATTGGGGGSGGGSDRAGTAIGANGSDHREPTQHMRDLAHTWYHTNRQLEKARRDVEELPKRIAHERAKLAGHDGHSNVHSHNLATAQRDLDIAKANVPQLEKQRSDLEKQYHDSGYDDVHYSTWTPGETLIGGRGIEKVGIAASMSGSPAGLKPTNIEYDIALGVPTVLALGRAALARGAARAAAKAAEAKAAADKYIATVPRTRTTTTTAAGRYEIEHTGAYNYRVSGGGAEFNIDGYRGSTILESKHVGDVKSSPYVPGSSCPDAVRAKVLKGSRDELQRIRKIIESGTTPFKSVEIITNTPESKTVFEKLLEESGVPGIVRLKP